nr:FCD domain-containing protein [Planococcus faecalis]
MFPGKATRVTTIKKGPQRLVPPLAVLQALSAELAIPNLDEHVFRLLEETNQRFIEAIESQNGFSALKIDQSFIKLLSMLQIILISTQSSAVSSLM